jgi:hypothetical protein
MGKDSATGIKIALLILLVTFCYLFSVTFFPMTEDGAEQAKTITPFLLGTVIGTLVGFYYGNKHEQQKGPLTDVDAAAIDAAKKIAEIKVEETKEDVKDATKNQ